MEEESCEEERLNLEEQPHGQIWVPVCKKIVQISVVLLLLIMVLTLGLSLSL